MRESAADVQTTAAHRASQESRSATFSGSSSIGISPAMIWRNKATSCETIRSFEASRKAQIDVFQEKDRTYWQHFEKEIVRAKEENVRLQRFFALRLQADLAYAESLRKIRQVIEKPAITGLPNTAGHGGSTGAAGSAVDQFSVLSSCTKALNTLGEVQQQQSEKITQFTNVIRRDVVLRPLEEMIATYDERSAAMIVDGNKYDAMLYEAQKHVVDAFAKYDTIFRDMESEKNTSSRGETTKRDLWLAEIAYTINVQKLRQTRVEYVKGMSALFQQYKTLEVLRVSVIQTALDTYIRKQKLLYDELSGAMSEPMSTVQVGVRCARFLAENTSQRIQPERDLLHSVRRIPTNHTAAALSTESVEQALFGSLRSPIASPLLVRCGFLKLQVSGSIFRSTKDVLCAITQDEFLHLIDLKENSNRSILQSSEAMLDAICTNDATHDVVCTTVCLTHCKIEILGKSDVPSFEVTEMTQATGLFSSMLGIETTRKFTFQCPNQTDLIDWVVAAKRFISTGSFKSKSTANRPPY
uniref:PH domain-containing protein n=1 Tax=Globisporangium ultimum (strain ATCC 200006 / CBS 805.95 / DAOM BR144) TaxID=431595 RepID=K3XAL8_GLOUD